MSYSLNSFFLKASESFSESEESESIDRQQENMWNFADHMLIDLSSFSDEDTTEDEHDEGSEDEETTDDDSDDELESDDGDVSHDEPDSPESDEEEMSDDENATMDAALAQITGTAEVADENEDSHDSDESVEVENTEDGRTCPICGTVNAPGASICNTCSFEFE